MHPYINPNKSQHTYSQLHSLSAQNRPFYKANFYERTHKHHTFEIQNKTKQKHSTATILQYLNDENMKQRSFNENWRRMINILQGYVKFVNYMPVSVSQQGNQLLHNGRFIIHWLEIMKLCPFVCFPLLLNHAANSYQNCLQHTQQFESYCATWVRPNKNSKEAEKYKEIESIKRNIHVKQKFLREQNQMKINQQEELTTESQPMGECF